MLEIRKHKYNKNINTSEIVTDILDAFHGTIGFSILLQTLVEVWLLAPDSLLKPLEVYMAHTLFHCSFSKDINLDTSL